MRALRAAGEAIVGRFDWLTRKHQAYAGLFLGRDDRRHGNAAVVWDDLKRFCGDEREGLVVSPVTRQSDPYASAFLAGKQAVFKRIQRYTYLNLDTESTDGSITSSGGGSDDGSSGIE
jgi:hypothetical protein